MFPGLRRFKRARAEGRGRDLLADLLSGDGERILAAASAFTAANPDASSRSRLCQQLLEVLRDPDRPAAQRVSAGDALGSLEDPRFDPEHWFLPREEAAGFLEVPAGAFLMGSDPQRDPMADQDELPRHPVSLPTYYISRYPVTVRQFREFAVGVLQHGDFDSPGQRTHRPVLWISWVDARAYCAWIEKRLLAAAPCRLRAAVDPRARSFWQGLAEGRLRIRLPSEAEWERAARGAEDRVFPWGDAYRPGRANTAEEGMKRPTPVGAMPGGAAASGCEDLSGNVWELTRSPYGPYPHDPAGEADLEDDPGLRAAIRGGSFLAPARLARCASRDGVPKGGEGQDLGFRLVATPASQQARRRRAWPGLPSNLSSLPQRLRQHLLQAVGTEERFEQVRNASLVDESVAAWERLVTDHAFPFTEVGFQNDTLCDAGRVLLLRYRLRGDAGDLRKAVERLRAALATSPDTDPDVLVNLATALREHHAAHGVPEDLEESMRIAEQAVEAAAEGSAATASSRVALGLSLADRYRREGGLADLERAIGLFTAALPLVAPGSPDRASVLNDLGLGLGYRFERTRQPDDLRDAVQAFEAAVRGTAGNPPELPVRLHNLGKALAESYLASGDASLLDRAVDAGRRGIESLPRGSADLPMLLEGQAERLFLRHLAGHDPADLDRAIEHWERAADVAPAGGSGRISSRAGLAGGLIARHGLNGDPKALARARALLREVCAGGLDRAAGQVWTSARQWIQWAFAREAWEEAAEAWPHADRALARLLAAQLGRRARETWLREVGAATREACYAIAKTGDLEAAAVALDRGLARLLAAALQADRVELGAVEREHPEIAGRYREAAGRVARFEDQEIRGEGGRLPTDAGAARQAHADLATAIGEIRRLPGHERFLQPAGIADLHAAARALGQRAALMYLATTGSGSLALVVTASQVEAIWAELSTPRLEAFLVRHEGASLAGGYLPGILSDRREASTWLDEALASIGEVLGDFLGRVARHLGRIGIEQVVLLPAGRLRALPLHVVPYVRDGGPASLFEDFVVSHAPNAVALQTACAEAAHRKAAGRLVAVGNPLPSPLPLPAAEAEAREIARMFPGARLLAGEDATRAGLLAVTSWCDAIHFGCHGFFDLDSPLDSRLQLAGDDSLTLRDFLDRTASLPAARLAVLSACQSAVAEPLQLADEVVSLPSGLLRCGVPGVVGTLWPVADVSTAMVMVKLYELLRERSAEGWPPLGPAAALAAAQRWLRDAGPAELQSFAEAHPALLHVLEAERGAGPVDLGELLRRDLRTSAGPPYFDHPYHWAPFVYYGV